MMYVIDDLPKRERLRWRSRLPPFFSMDAVRLSGRPRNSGCRAHRCTSGRSEAACGSSLRTSHSTGRLGFHKLDVDGRL